MLCAVLIIEMLLWGENVGGKINKLLIKFQEKPAKAFETSNDRSFEGSLANKGLKWLSRNSSFSDISDQQTISVGVARADKLL